MADTVLHLVQCLGCRERLIAWNEKPRLEQLLRALADGSGIGAEQAAGGNGPSGSMDVDAVTKIYASKSPRRVGQYELLRSIGKGGGGEVFEAMHVLLRRRLAVKLLSIKDAGNATVRRRFFREMESIGQLDHPHIVHAHDAGEADGTLYLAMELIDGENVESLARRVGPLPVAEACEIVRQAALGLQHIHESGLVHRDLKPSNLLTSAAGVKIADLGLALLHRENSKDDRLTGHHTIVGTADYMAPEQAEGSHDVDIRADLYSLGCTLFRLLAGRPPFAMPENTTPVKKMWAHQSQPIPEIQQFRSDIPPNLAALLRRLMAKNPDDRFAEPRELAEALLPFSQTSDVPSLILPGLVELPMGERSSTARDPTDPLKSRSQGSIPTTVRPVTEQVRRPPIANIALSVVVVGLLGWLGFQRWRQPIVQPNNQEQIVPPVAVASPEKSPADKSPAYGPSIVKGVVVEPKMIELPPAEPIVPLGPIATRWKSEFGQVPTEIQWGRPTDVGSVRIDEEFRSLVVQAHQSIRLVQLGEIKEQDQGMTLRFTVNNRSRGGEYGVFFGFRKDQSDLPEFIEFQLIAVVFLAATDTGDNIIVRRSRERFDIRTGISESSRNHHVRMRIPNVTDNQLLEIRTEKNAIAEVIFGGKSCTALCTPQQNSHYFHLDHEGPFGLFVDDGTVWFNTPRLERSSR